MILEGIIDIDIISYIVRELLIVDIAKVDVVPHVRIAPMWPCTSSKTLYLQVNGTLRERFNMAKDEIGSFATLLLNLAANPNCWQTSQAIWHMFIFKLDLFLFFTMFFAIFPQNWSCNCKIDL